MTAPSRPAALRLLVGATSLAVLATGTAVLASTAPAEPADGSPARTVPFHLAEDKDVDVRLPRPEDRYAMAGGCYTVEAPGQGFLVRSGDALAVGPADQAVPLHFQATRLGEYLLATNEGRDTAYEGAWWDVRGYLGAATTGGLLPADAVTVADAPAEDTEWRVVAAGDDPDGKAKDGFQLTVPSREAALTVAGGAVALAPGEGTPLQLHHVRDDDPSDDDPNGAACATWPEVDTGASGEPEPVARHEADVARGFFEAHVHGMAFEFLGGELRCGRPWHEYGVEFALGGCDREGKPLNRFLEVALAGQSPTDPVDGYDPVGWPTFSYWPKHDTLTHEQFYWRWLERAHAGGLRLLTNLLVDNTALCQLYPQKKNSCNEMDGVRLQAQRLFELQDYVDAQEGGPGEGWLRIVTSPAQARQVINDGRLAIVLGIEISELFDCGEYLDQPECTAEQIDDRLQEAYDMGVRQMELVNKFDNALTGVTGDGGTTGPVVNTGNKHVTGHFWDMRGCEPEGHAHEHGLEGREHDKTQIVPTDATPEDGEGIDALAGRIFQQFGGVSSVVAPVYGPGPHCNTRGLTELGKHVITRMVEKGMVFDPDHMSASAQRAALDHLEDLWEQEQADAAAEGRPAVRPAAMSSHSWGNDVTYQRIYQLDGVVAPRTGDAATFAGRWAKHKDWAAVHEPGYDPAGYGLGYGADTNGLGGQPGPRGEAAQRLSYDQPFAAPIGGVTLTQQTSGLRTFDVNTEGVPHYGLFADWFREVALAADELFPERGGGAAVTEDMLRGAETYLQMWERAVYGGGDCVTDRSALQVEDLHAALGLNLEGFLTAVGQPVSRDGAAYRYCAAGADGTVELVDVVFDEDGRAAELVGAGPVPTEAQPGTGTAGTTAGTTITADAVGAAASALHDHASHEHDDDAAGTVVAAPAAGADDEQSLAASLTSSPVGLGVSALVLLAVGMLVAQVLVDRRRRAQA